MALNLDVAFLLSVSIDITVECVFFCSEFCLSDYMKHMTCDYLLCSFMHILDTINRFLPIHEKI